ncbi:MAG: diguanylate cyclase [Candidatus Omnitrophica bacterium]|nr:diguanylate cyclase [Candidatus Omnitrophota bacterium]
MTVIPLLVLLYVTTAFIPLNGKSFFGDFGLLIGISALISGLGFIVARDIILPTLTMVHQAKRLAQGVPLENLLTLDREDEIGELGSSLGRINQRIIDHMTQLRWYGDEVKQLNTEIHQRILALSNLLQVSNLISQGASLDEVLACVMEKLTQLEDADLYALMVPMGEAQGGFRLQAAHGTNPQSVAALRGTTMVSVWLTQLARDNQTWSIVDAQHGSVPDRKELRRLYGLENAMVIPVTAHGRTLALLVAGNNRPEFNYNSESIETLRVFAKQVAIAVENDFLTKRTKALTVTDDLTGLYNEGYIRVRLEEEVHRAGLFHHPCSYVLLDVDGFSKIQQTCGVLASEHILKEFSRLLLKHVSAVDKVARLGGDRFALVLPERTKREAIALAEQIRKDVGVFIRSPLTEPESMPLTVSCGVSENPLDGATAQELFEKASESLKLAKQQGKNRIVAP